MKMTEIRELTDAELDTQLQELKQESFNLRIQSKTGQLESPARMKQVRRDVARIKTEKTARITAAGS